MKRLLAALAASLLIASGAHAKGLVVVPGTSGGANPDRGIQFEWNYVAQVLNSMGADYDLVTASSIPSGQGTSALRRGRLYRPGTSGAVATDTTTYNPIIHLAFSNGTYSGTVTATVKPNDPVAGVSTVRTGTAEGFRHVRAGYTLSGTGVTTGAVVTGVDSLFCRMYVAGATGTGASITLTWSATYRPDSLTTRGYYPSVTHVFLGNRFTTPFVQSGACSSGVSSSLTASTTSDSSTVHYLVSDPTVRWIPVLGGASHVVASTRDSRGFRPIIGSMGAAQGKGMASLSSGAYDDPCAACGTSANPDTVGGLWEILNYDNGTTTPIQRGTQAAAVPMVFAQSAAAFSNTSGEMSNYAAAFLLADSLSGGGLFNTAKSNLPLTASIHIDDGWKRGRSSEGATAGIAYNDTTALTGSIALLAALRVPFVVGVEIDSLDGVLIGDRSSTGGLETVDGANPYRLTSNAFFDGGWVGWTVHGPGVPRGTRVVSCTATELFTNNPVTTAGSALTFGNLGHGNLYDKRWWALAPLAHYTPHCHAGATTLNETRPQLAPGTQYPLALDLWGTARARTYWAGLDGTDTTSYFTLHRRAFAVMDSTFGVAKVDHAGMPPGDDWTPPTCNSTQRCRLDSLFNITAYAGWKRIRANAGTTLSYAGPNHLTSPQGWQPAPLSWTVSMEPVGLPSMSGQVNGLVSCSGYPSLGSKGSPFSTTTNALYGRDFPNAVLGPQMMDTITNQLARSNSSFFPFARVRVLAIHVSDLGSDGTFARRPGYYNIKWAVNRTRMMNSVARVSAFEWVYPQELPL